MAEKDTLRWLRRANRENYTASRSRGLDPIVAAWYRGRASMCAETIREITGPVAPRPKRKSKQ